MLLADSQSDKEIIKFLNLINCLIINNTITY